MLLLNKNDINKVFSMRDAIEADKLAFSIFSSNKSIAPLRTNFASENEKGNILYMPGYVPSLSTSGLKVVSVFPNNPSKGLPATVGTVLLVDDTTGQVSAVLDGTYVTAIRTGAASGCALDILARKDSKIGALIGTGSQAESQLDAMVEACKNLTEVRVFSITEDKKIEFVENMNKKYGEKDGSFPKIVAASSSDEAITDADVIVMATTSTKPVINGNLVKKGATVSGVGSYMPTMHEMDDALLKRANKIYFDSEDAVLSEAGCILTPLANGTITKEDFTGDIGQVINGDIVGRENEDEIIVFKTVGISVQDLVTANEIFKKAKENNVGTEWE